MSQTITTGKPGRPPKHIKKGNSSWAPASVTDVTNKEPGYRYRWALKTPENISKKEMEGWETVSSLIADGTTPVDDGRVHTGKKLTSTYEKHDVILQRIPEELALERDEYFNNESKRRTQGLTSHLKKEIKDKGGNAPVHGDITISSRSGTQIIE